MVGALEYDLRGEEVYFVECFDVDVIAKHCSNLELSGVGTLGANGEQLHSGMQLVEAASIEKLGMAVTDWFLQGTEACPQ